MGRRGPQAAPTALKLLRGNPGKRRLNRREPQAKGCPPRPPGLTPGARQAWDRIVPLLERMGVVGEIDAAALELWCTWFDRWQRLVRTLRKEGEVTVYRTVEPVTVLEDGEERTEYREKVEYYARPEAKLAATAFGQLVTLGRDFGLTPSSRSGIRTAGGEEEADPLAKFLPGGKDAN